MTGLQTLAWLTDPWTYGLVLIVALLLFGKRLPEVGRSLGRGIAEFKKGLHDVQDELTREEPQPPQNKLQPPAGPVAPPRQLYADQPPTPPATGPGATPGGPPASDPGAPLPPEHGAGPK